jgi:hypothetical protein
MTFGVDLCGEKSIMVNALGRCVDCPCSHAVVA